MTSPHSQSVATGIGLAEPPIINPDVLQRTEKEKKELEEKLHYMESVLREMVSQNEATRKEKSTIENEMDRVVSELKETKIAWAVSEEAQAENEMQLKNKINYLVKEVVKSTGKAPDMSSHMRSQNPLPRARSPKMEEEDFSEGKPKTMHSSKVIHTTNVNCFNISCHVL